MTIHDQGCVFLAEPGSDRTSACFPGLCVLPDGRGLVAFRAAPRKVDAHPQRVLLTWSDDAGRTWTPATEPFAPEDVMGVRGEWRCGQPCALGGRRVAMVLYWVDASDPARPFFNRETEGLLDSRIFLVLSEDGGATWSRPRLLDTSPFTVPTPITGPLLPLANGEWALQFETNKAYLDTAPWRHQAVLMFSRDAGRSWPEFVDVASDPAGRVYYWDQRPSILADNLIMAAFWTFDRVAGEYRNIHARVSSDCGRTWGELWDTGVPGQPAPLVPLRDGRICMVYVDRSGVPVIKARLSADGGRTWPTPTEQVLAGLTKAGTHGSRSDLTGAWDTMEAYSLGLPVTARLADDGILVVHYAGTHPDHTGLHWVRLQQSPRVLIQ